MTTLAELLRQEQKNSLLKEIPSLPERVVNSIRNSGRFVIICDKHISEDNVKDSNPSALPNRFDFPIQQWAREQGFRSHNIYNSYGVKMIEITL